MLGAPSPRCENRTARGGAWGTEPFVVRREPWSVVTQAGGGLRAARPHRRGVNHQPREARGMGDPGRFSAHSLHPLQPRARGLVRAIPLTEEPLAPFGPGGPCGEGQGISGVGPFPPGPRL